MSDSSKVFIDSNILVYALDGRFPDKRQMAAESLRSLQNRGGGVVSTQVLQECYVAATSKLGIEPLTAKEALVKLKALELVLVDFALIQDAIDTGILNQISFWDALIVVSARKGRLLRAVDRRPERRAGHSRRAHPQPAQAAGVIPASIRRFRVCGGIFY